MLRVMNKGEIYMSYYSFIACEYKLPALYSPKLNNSDDRCKQLYNYLINNCERWKKCEVWSICLANARSKRTFKMGIKDALEDLAEITVSLNELTQEHIKYTLYEGSTPIRLMIY